MSDFRYPTALPKQQEEQVKARFRLG